MIYFNSKYLSEKLGINLAKWKRWVREFLPPDPLGGLQSGYARQFNLKEAFRVYLGGQLVSALRFSIPEARHILADLDAGLEADGYYNLYPKQGGAPVEMNWLSIYPMPDGGFKYGVGVTPAAQSFPAALFGRLIHLSEIYTGFLDRIGGVNG